MEDGQTGGIGVRVVTVVEEESNQEIGPVQIQHHLRMGNSVWETSSKLVNVINNCALELMESGQTGEYGVLVVTVVEEELNQEIDPVQIQHHLRTGNSVWATSSKLVNVINNCVLELMEDGQTGGIGVRVVTVVEEESNQEIDPVQIQHHLRMGNSVWETSRKLVNVINNCVLELMEDGQTGGIGVRVVTVVEEESNQEIGPVQIQHHLRMGNSVWETSSKLVNVINNCVLELMEDGQTGGIGVRVVTVVEEESNQEIGPVQIQHHLRMGNSVWETSSKLVNVINNCVLELMESGQTGEYGVLVVTVVEEELNQEIGPVQIQHHLRTGNSVWATSSKLVNVINNFVLELMEDGQTGGIGVRVVTVVEEESNQEIGPVQIQHHLRMGNSVWETSRKLVNVINNCVLELNTSGDSAISKQLNVKWSCGVPLLQQNIFEKRLFRPRVKADNNFDNKSCSKDGVLNYSTTSKFKKDLD
ncbi:uncharacterized protein LOC123540413 isoform X2 [Mercenaria mercenaria]|uniref:uncharacterized protein LOC123540413 isoform X2 n=1 Tax=Mercenaria mercenaria TaxID=6596 RepID=UPI00234F18A9|nr:uncharacterized protein LOC123540413 isoform X2 [Mercenaria mercenaria]